jgi:hypothetical protein
MFREIRTSERITEVDENKINYNRIKPESEMSIEEINSLINGIFMEEAGKAES